MWVLSGFLIPWPLIGRYFKFRIANFELRISKTFVYTVESDRAGIWLDIEYVLLPEDRHLQLFYVCACIRRQEGIYKSAPELVRPVSDRGKERHSVDL